MDLWKMQKEVEPTDKPVEVKDEKEEEDAEQMAGVAALSYRKLDIDG